MPRNHPKSRLRYAMSQLGQFYGIHGAGGVHVSMIDPGEFNIVAMDPEAGVPENVTGDYGVEPESYLSRLQGTFSAVCGMGESTPTTAAILAEFDLQATEGGEATSLAGPMMVYPDAADPDIGNFAAQAGMGLLHAGNGAGGVPFFQGLKPPTNGQFYTSTDCMPDVADEEVAAGLAKVSVIQVFPPSAAPNREGTDIVSLFANGIPPSEMNQCVPYLEIVVVTGFDRANAGATTPPMSTERFLLGNSVIYGTGELVPDASLDINLADSINKAQYDQLPNNEFAVNGAYSDTPQFTGNHKVLTTAGGMDLFTMPQSMVNAESAVARDPFRPFMSIMSFKSMIHMKSKAPGNRPGGGGMVAITDETATLRLRLHDRGRLGDIAGLVSPHEHGTTQLLITYGWSHPHSLRLDRPSDADSGARFGDILGLMKVTKAYRPINVRFSFEDSGEVNIDLDLTTASCGLDRYTKMMTDAPEDEDSSIGGYAGLLQKALQTVTDAQKSAQVIGRGKTFKKVLPALFSDSDGFIKGTKEVKVALEKFIANIAATGQLTAGELSSLDAVFAKHDGSTALGAMPTGEAALNRALKELKKKPDPFLRVKGAGVKTSNSGGVSASYVSLGKLLTWFVASPLRASKNAAEIQLVFYACNHNAGGLFNFNLASFPILLKDFEKKIKAHMKLHKQLSVHDFCTYIENYVAAQDESAAYGRQGRDSTSKAKSIAAIYQPGVDGARGDFQRVLLEITPYMAPSRSSVQEKNEADTVAAGKPILQLHIQDQHTMDGGQRLFMDVYGALSSGMVFQASARDSASDVKALGGTPGEYPYCSNHDTQYTKAFEALEAQGIITQIDGGLIDATGATSTKLAALKDQYYVVTNDIDKIKSVVTQVQPSLIYGGANTAIERMQVQTIQNPADKNIARSRRGSTQERKELEKKSLEPKNYMSSPVQINMDMLGCPFIQTGQKYFIDMGTNTDIDGMYTVGKIDVNVEPGKYTSSIELKQTQSREIDVAINSTLSDLIVAYAKKLG